MPQKPKKPIGRRTEGGLTGPELEDLVRGDCVLDHDRDPFPSEEARRAAWAKHRGFILGLQGREAQGESFGLASGTEYFRVFERPAAWWDYAAPEPRRLLGHEKSASDPRVGVPVALRMKRPVYESERDYLLRHDLLNEEEQSALMSTADTTFQH